MRKSCAFEQKMSAFLVRSSDELVPSITQYSSIFYLNLVL